MRAMGEVVEQLGLEWEAIEPYGRDKVKVPLAAIPQGGASGKLVVVTAITPTPAGEGKTTTSIGLTDGLARIGKRAVLAIREPSLGPLFGMKGGGTGGGRATVEPAADINLPLHRRLPRDPVRAQLPRLDGGQRGQLPRDRRLRRRGHHLAAGDGRRGPRAAADRDRRRRARRRAASRHGVRHLGGVGDHGHRRARLGLRRPEAAPLGDCRGLGRRRPGPCAPAS